ncbi:MAG: hypothetical protein GMKNLPBB_02278 [Myxococcota bacterium]|nr:hypothetical protein [Myxococcota bacterium]
MLTIRLRIEDPAGVLDLSPLPIFTFFHGRQFALPQAAARRRIAVLTSLSRDGALLAGVLRMQGLQVARGSSSRGGAAGLVTLLHQMSGGAGAALAVDGPRGPAEAVKPGVFALAEQTGRPIIPTGIAYSRAWRLRGAWDGFRIPSPFSRITVRLGHPFHTTGDPAQDPVLLAGAIRALQNDDG